MPEERSYGECNCPAKAEAGDHDATMFDVEPLSWEQMAVRLGAEKIAALDEIDRLRRERDEFAELVRSAVHLMSHPGRIFAWRRRAIEKLTALRDRDDDVI